MLTKIFGVGMGAMFVAMIAMYGLWTWQVNRLKGQMVALQNAKLELEVQTKAQEATIKFLEKQKAVRVRVIREKTDIDEATGSGDVNRVRDLYNRYRVRPKGGIQDTAPGRKGSPTNKPSGKAPTRRVLPRGAG